MNVTTASRFKSLRQLQRTWAQVQQIWWFKALSVAVLIPILLVMSFLVTTVILTLRYFAVPEVPYIAIVAMLTSWVVVSSRPRSYGKYRDTLVEADLARKGVAMPVPRHGWIWQDLWCSYRDWELSSTWFTAAAKTVVKPLLAIALLLTVPVLGALAGTRAAANLKDDTSQDLSPATIEVLPDSATWPQRSMNAVILLPVWCGFLVTGSRSAFRGRWRRSVWARLSEFIPEELIGVEVKIAERRRELQLLEEQRDALQSGNIGSARKAMEELAGLASPALAILDQRLATRLGANERRGLWMDLLINAATSAVFFALGILANQRFG